MYQIDQIDKDILMILQRGIPICHRPYQVMAEEIGKGITEQEVIDRIAVMKQENIIRRMSGFFNSRKMGYTSALCAIRVVEEHIEDVAQIINHFPGITHNYLRQHEYNMWFTIISSCPEELETILRIIEQNDYVEKVLRLYSNKRFKINVTFDLSMGGEQDE